MDVGWIQDFLAVAESRNFTRAANDRNVSQAAFSRRIQSLEAWLGVALIDRSVFPTRLTAEGERFKENGAVLLRQLLDARAELHGAPLSKRDLIRMALPHALATGRVASWWKSWAEGQSLNCQVIPSNVHDAVTSLAAGDVEILVCFHHAQQPMHLDPMVYERLELGVEVLRPYASPELAQQITFPGTADSPLPYLGYSRGTYLGRMVDLLIDSTPDDFHGVQHFKSDMADVLKELAICGNGVAWLPGCTARMAGDRLVPVGDDKWAMTL